MKFSLALLALSASADEDKKFVNKNKFMSANPPRWWSKKTPDERYEYIGSNLDNLFDRHFPDTKAQIKLKPLFESLYEDAAEFAESCAPGKRF